MHEEILGEKDKEGLDMVLYTYMFLSAIDEMRTRPGISLFIDCTIIHSICVYILNWLGFTSNY